VISSAVSGGQLRVRDVRVLGRRALHGSLSRSVPISTLDLLECEQAALQFNF